MTSCLEESRADNAWMGGSVLRGSLEVKGPKELSETAGAQLPIPPALFPGLQPHRALLVSRQTTLALTQREVGNCS